MRQASRVLVRNGNHYLIIHNIKDGRNRWEFPGGKTDPGESSLEAAGRELTEEVNLVIIKGLPIDFIQKVYLNIGGGDWEVDFWLIERDFVEGAVEIMEPHKFTGLKWVTIDEYARLPQIPALGVDVIRTAEAML